MFDWTGAAGQDGPKDVAGSRDSAGSVWPMRGHDLRHTGQSAVDTSSNTGDLLWRFTPEGQNNYINSPPTVGPNGTIYFGSDDNYLYAVNPDGRMEWKFKTGNLVRDSPTIDANGTIYFSSDDYFLYALNPDGSKKWNALIKNDNYDMNYMASSPMVLKNGTVYVGSDDSNLYAIDANGNIKWTYKTTSNFASTPAVGDDGSIYLGAGGYLYKIAPDGTLLWRFPLTIEWISAPAIGSSGTVYVPSDHYLYAIDQDGTFDWMFDTVSDGLPSNPAIGNDGTIYFGTSGALYAIDNKGTLKWKYEETEENWKFSAPTLDSKGTVYVVSPKGFFYAFNPDGSVKWARRIAAHAQTSGLTIGPGGAIYMGIELSGSENESNVLMALGRNGTYSEVPKAPTGLNVVKYDNYIDLQWDPPQEYEGLPILKYEIFNAKSPRDYANHMGSIAKTNGTNTTYRYVPTNEPFTYFAVAAVNRNGESPVSDSVTATSGIYKQPPAPGKLDSIRGSGYVVLTWDQPAAQGNSVLMGYKVYRRNGSADEDLLADVGPGVLSYNDTSVVAGSSYHYRIAAIYKNGDVGSSKEISVDIPNKTIPSPPEKPHPSGPKIPGTAVLVTTLGISSMSVLVIALAIGTDIGRFKMFTAMIPLHTKLKREKVLDHIERGRIVEYVIKNPGADYSEIGTNLDLDNGVLAYHLKVLERAEYLKSVTAGLHKRFYSFESTIPEDAHKTIQEMIIDYVIAHPDATRKELAEAMGTPLSTINYHCDLLVRANVLQSSKIGKRKSYRLQEV